MQLDEARTNQLVELVFAFVGINPERHRRRGPPRGGGATRRPCSSWSAAQAPVDAAGGSSGSPICDDLWFVAGLHRGWTPITGGPVKVWGKDIKQENYGTPIGLILADIQSKDPAMRAEIEAGQSA